MSTWVIPGEPLQWVVLDEPYDKFDRSSWADKNQFAVKECYRNGLYRGGPTFATVFSSSVELADNAAEALATIHATKINVIKDVGVYDSRFRSPYDVASQAKPQPRTMPLPAGTVQDDSVAYGTLAGEKSSWRPNFTLPIEEHLKIGPVLAALLPIFESDDEDPLHEVKFDLCNWFFLEHGDAITPKIEAAYDGHNEDGADRKLREALDTPAGRVNAVRWVVDVLTRGYPSCKALDIQVAALRTSEKFTSSSA
jgi:hypothetical protein